MALILQLPLTWLKMSMFSELLLRTPVRRHDWRCVSLPLPSCKNTPSAMASLIIRGTGGGNCRACPLLPGSSGPLRSFNNAVGRFKKSCTSGKNTASLSLTALVKQGPCSTSLGAHIVNSCCLPPSTPWQKSYTNRRLSKPGPPHPNQPPRSPTQPVNALPNGSCRPLRRCSLPPQVLPAPGISARPQVLPETPRTPTRRATTEVCVRFTICRDTHHVRYSLVLAAFSPLVSQSPVRAAWHARRHERNKRMHALVGNTGPFKGQPHLSLVALNVGGLHNSTKWMALRNHPADLIVLSETQLQRHLHSTISIEFAKYHTLLSPGLDDKHFTGVAVLAKRSRFWAARTLQWSPDHPCHRFWADNRLMCTQLWCGAGDTSIFCYAVYLPSGARWEAPKKTYAHALLQAVRDDLLQRGDVVAVLAGDFNLQVEDSFLLRQWRFDGPFYDVSTKSPPDIRDAPTCHQGKGSKIDFVWVSRVAYDLAQDYSVRRLSAFKTHSALEVSVNVPTSVQVRRTQRQVAAVPVLSFPTASSRVFRPPEDRSFQDDLSAGRVSQAFNTWTKQAEQVLFQVAEQQGHHVDAKAFARRGVIKFQDTRFFPSVKGEAATTMVDRKLYKALCRVQEVGKARAGYRRSLTWQHVHEVLPHLHSPFREQL